MLGGLRNVHGDVFALHTHFCLATPIYLETLASERSFSAPSRARLNWCMLLHIHKARTDNLPTVSIANESTVDLTDSLFSMLSFLSRPQG